MTSTVKPKDKKDELSSLMGIIRSEKQSKRLRKFNILINIVLILIFICACLCGGFGFYRASKYRKGISVITTLTNYIQGLT